MSLIAVALLAASLFASDQTDSAPHEASPAVDAASLARLSTAAPSLVGIPDVTLKGYPVEGRNGRAIRASMNAGRPAEMEGGERFDGVTRWTYQSRGRRSGPDQCLPETAEVALAVTVVLPDLTTRADLSSREGAAWDAYFERLVTHEHNHVRIAVLGAERMQAAMRAAADCAGMQAARQRISAEVREASLEYDRLTDHGRREGAVYPPAGRR
jgi:predicted secreted Zn-dependent protease